MVVHGQSAMRWIERVLWLGVILWAGFLRFSDLDQVPMHADEAENAFMLQEWSRDRDLRYDPLHHHGLTLYVWADLLLGVMPGVDRLDPELKDLRMVSAVPGTLLVLFALWMRPWLGPWGALIFGFLIACNPGLIAYSRSFIHEILLVFSFAGCLVGVGQWLRDGRNRWMVFSGFCLGVMVATKETWLAVAGTVVLAGCVVIWSEGEACWLRCKSELRKRWVTLGWMLGVAFVVTVVFYSSFGRNPAGVWDAVRTFWLYETNPAHNKAWTYYLSLWFESRPLGRFHTGELLLLPLFLLGLYCGLRKGAHAVVYRFAVLFTLIQLGTYSSLSYKTPWLMVVPSVGYALIVTLGLRGVASRGVMGRWRYWALLSVGIVLASVGRDSFRYAKVLPDHRHNRYAYVPTSPDLVKATGRILGYASVHPAGEAMPVALIFPDGSNPWPLPWYLRRLVNVRYYPAKPDGPLSAAIVICPLGISEEIRSALGLEGWIAEMRGIRSGELMVVYISRDLWFLRSSED